ncbi:MULTISPECIES: sn-glycerol-3-phosphate ABC transporter permease UgpE [Limnochorda]|uniref:sn-glycerol-3-phosphate ABC transporter permease UgpE n=1 Tax=Limnochorda TaxID=1676651 RepID=UPI0017BA2793|nr:sn-glycerol-3-phosphate ABC transporter permease UgpE [Bacillota bacterium]MBO2520009.1 sn-glycerol-3-phosphate ABC transporter permease UgpE [Bacillota bacterium]NMA72072.1 sn-glycerol-3-phosphate ABC transporter permease UgpE [Bacillota bacterium]
MIQPRAARARLKQRLGRLAAHLLLLVSIGIIAFPVYYVFVLSTQSMEEVVVRPTILRPSTHLVANYITAWSQAGMGRKLLNSLVVAITVAVGKIVISLLSAFAIVYFRFALRKVVFWLIFITLMLPVEVRIVATYQVVSDLGWLNSYVGLTVPLMASATATFLFRQFLQTVPGELAEAAQLDGAGPMRFLWSILLPLSWTNIAALFVVLFVYGWNQYLWPLMITHTEEMQVAVIGIKQLVNPELPQWNITMAAAMMTLLPPVLVILVMQRWFVKGLIESEK